MRRKDGGDAISLSGLWWGGRKEGGSESAVRFCGRRIKAVGWSAVGLGRRLNAIVHGIPRSMEKRPSKSRIRGVFYTCSSLWLGLHSLLASVAAAGLTGVGVMVLLASLLVRPPSSLSNDGN